MTQGVLWQPHSGPQTDFLKASEYEVLYGGAAGGGKTDAILFGALRYWENKNYRALILRKTFPELQEVMDRAIAFREFGATWNETKKRWRFPSGATIEFGYFERWDHHVRYQGQEYQYIAWDEIGTVPEERWWTFLMSRNRTADPGMKNFMRATANPGGAGHAWLKRRFIDPCQSGDKVYEDGKTKLKRRFIPAKLSDNPSLDLTDPAYRTRLQSLPDILRRQLLEGDWTASAGMALGELNRSVHLMDALPYDKMPPYWWFFGSMDWGYAHPTAFGFWAAAADKKLYLIDSLHLWQKTPLEIAERVQDRLNTLKLPILQYIAAGRDCWADVRARGENVPTVAEQFIQYGLPLVPANISRVSGLNNMRAYFTTIGPIGDDGFPMDLEPRCQIFKTDGNFRTYDILESMVLDPLDMEDALKIDVDEFGEGGDDPYDMVRYGMASRPLHPMKPTKKKMVNRDFDSRFQTLVERHSSQRDPKYRRAGKRRGKVSGGHGRTIYEEMKRRGMI